ncbi:MAG TPA: cupin domain-containing protein [Burkholderiales bacterium]|jgi:50S ribosomal protein L16 3-hydroxylase|nr:cupin domain-containing protein [Burkholderiales bacterium]
MPARQFTDNDRIPVVKIPLLGGLSASSFLRRHWQKNPLLVRKAIPGFEGIVDFRAMVELAGRDDCESRLLLRNGRHWTIEHGPFASRYLSRLPQHNWTLLVQGVNLFLPEARQLLSRFDFIPYSRLDDLMVSYAPPGGGVGPHFDSYDVFLLQGPGQRRWKVGRQDDLTLVDGAPLKILRHFVPQGECVLGPGDMLYLPAGFTHDGVAVDACYTYSIGFRAPSHHELVSHFLMFLEERLNPSGRYEDPDLATQAHPAGIGAAMIAQVQRTLGSIRWNRGDVEEFLGTYLTEPKPHVLFSPPRGPLSLKAFLRSARNHGLELALPAQMLYSGSRLFINGESLAIKAGEARPLRALADARRLAGREVPRTGTAAEALYRWYRSGYILPATRAIAT